MNYSMISYILGWIFNFEAAFMILPGITAIIYREKNGLAFLITMLICLTIGIPLTRRKRKSKVFHAKEGAVTVALSWLVLSIAGALPFIISGSIPHPIDAIFETVSGFTTTGASILNNVEALSHCMLIWRSFTHRNGSTGIYSLPAASYRWIPHESDESREPGTVCQQIGAEGTVHSQDFVYHIHYSDYCGDHFPSHWKNASV